MDRALIFIAPVALAISAMAGCPASGGDQTAGIDVGEAAASIRGSGDSFSAKLAADLAPMGYVPSAPAPVATPPAPTSAGSASTSAGSASTGAGSAIPPAPGSAAPLTPATPSAPPSTPAAASATTGTPASPGSAAPTAPPPPSPTPRTPAEVAAIKLSLAPNWKRDVQAPGTISLSVEGATTFTFNYGYDDPRAPADREQYKAFLDSSKLLAVTAERQRGSAVYYEGTDREGRAAFRFLVIYGGKRLVCYGPLYRDAAHNVYGDIRDQVVIQAKQICETLQL
ncbi:MAG: hypothetical protein AB7P03_04465 [Kofleriaceae bacterium]